MTTIETNLVQKSAATMVGGFLIGAAMIMIGSDNNNSNLMLTGLGACGGSFAAEVKYLTNQIKYGFYTK